ncbi:MAG: CoA transferase [Porticoccaceae bacterium]|nr:CoA transferase [Porticoccaceae bacterium]
MRKNILDGYSVLDLSQHLAGPTTTRLMAEMGAHVIKVELAPDGDPTRRIGYFEDGRSAYFVQQNRGKESLCIDVKTEKGLRVLKDLVKKVDVVLENFAPGVVKNIGIDWPVVHLLNPQVIMCSISALGQTGPLAHLPGIDYIAQAYAGVTDLIGEPDGPPSLPMLAMGDVMTGVHALAAINGALLDRAKTNEGQYLDISLVDSYYHCHELSVQMNSCTKGKVQARRCGAHHSAVAPMGVFKGNEGYIVLAPLRHWRAFCKIISREDLITNDKFVTATARVKNRFELAEIIEQWLQSCDSDADAIAQLEAQRITVAPVLTVPQTMEHPHFVERGTVRTIHDRILGDFQIPGMPLRFSKYPDPLPLEAPFLGEHNSEVLRGFLGYSADQTAAIEQAGILVSKDR